jgi:hypothetical protein
VRVSFPDKLALLANTYRRYGFRGAKALIRYYVAKRRAIGGGPGRECPVCGWNGPEFFPIVHPPIGLFRVKASCPTCGSLERHRALWFVYREFFRSHPSHARVLHFAPETCFRALFTSHAQHYFTSSFDHETSSVRLDLNHLGLLKESIDIVGFVPEPDRERLGVRADDFKMIQLRKLERQ